MRRKRKIDRSAGKLADANLIVIASEDQYAVKQYFNLFHSVRIQFEVLETEDGRSSPKDVLARLSRYMEEFQIGEGDQFWLVTDIDHWAEPGHIKNLTEVVKLCRQKNIGVATSFPCFDLWLLLHFSEMPEQQISQCSEIGELIRAAVGDYNKTKVYNLPITMQNVELAIKRAKAPEPKGPILSELGSEVYLIIENLVTSSVISIANDR